MIGIIYLTFETVFAAVIVRKRCSDAVDTFALNVRTQLFRTVTTSYTGLNTKCGMDKM